MGSHGAGGGGGVGSRRRGALPHPQHASGEPSTEDATNLCKMVTWKEKTFRLKRVSVERVLDSLGTHSIPQVRCLCHCYPRPSGWGLRWPSVGNRKQGPEEELVHVAVRDREGTPYSLCLSPKLVTCSSEKVKYGRFLIRFWIPRPGHCGAERWGDSSHGCGVF